MNRLRWFSFLLPILINQTIWSAQASEVQIGPDGFLRVNGQPHFVIGMYNAGRYEEMARAGFSETHSYAVSYGEADEPVSPEDGRLKTLLDKNQTNGLRMMVELPRKAIEKGKWDQIRHRIETFRNHPGLLCWGSEERVARGLAPLTNLVTLYKLVHELDPNHPLVLGDTKDVIKKFKDDRRDFFPDQCTDIGIWWWYPIPLKEPEGNGSDAGKRTQLEPPSWLTTTHSKRPLWIAIQAYQQKSKEGRFPTPAEYRCLAYLSIINGVKGIFFYTGSGQKDFDGKPSGLLNKPQEGHWENVKSLAHELHDFSSIIMSQQPEERLVISPATAPVECALREHEGKLYVIAANKSPEPQHVSFKGRSLQGKNAKTLFEDHRPDLQADTLTDDFGPFGVHIYRTDSIRRD
jgi:hypothetical protein